MTVAIIIPTKNRSEFLLRQLKYYADVGCTHKLFIGDSSEGQHIDSTLDSISKLSGKIEIKHFQMPGLTEYEAIKEITKQVEEPYITLASDDDFLIPDALTELAGFLDSHADYNSAHGLALSFAVGLDRPYGEFVRTRLYPQYPSENINGRLRFLDFLPSYWPARFCVQRTGDFSVAAELATKPGDNDFQQLLASCVPIIRGKSKQFERLYLMRQSHIKYSRATDAFDWVTEPDWFASFTAFQSGLAEQLVEQDDIGPEEAEEVVNEGLRPYIAQRMGQSRPARSQLKGRRPRSLLRRVAKGLPGIAKLWQGARSIRTINPPGPDEFSLSVLLRPSASIHADFMPVYQAVTAHAD